MNFFPRLLFLTAILFVVLGLCNQESGNISARDHGLASIEQLSNDAGLPPNLSQELPGPAESQLAKGQTESEGRSSSAHERTLIRRYKEMMIRTNTVHRNRSPERMAMKGLRIHATGGFQMEDPSRS
jgi:hypothetical protein